MMMRNSSSNAHLSSGDVEIDQKAQLHEDDERKEKSVLSNIEG